MKVLILGGSGMLGHKLVQVLSKRFDVWTTLRSDLTQFESFRVYEKEKTYGNVEASNTKLIENIIRDVKPDVIINAVGVIKQKKESKNIINTLEINSIFPHKVAEIAKKYDVRFITLSTDCVFDGKKGKYIETDLPNATELYGKSKHLGEVFDKNCLTLRTSIIGREISTNKSLIEWFLNTNENPVKGFTNAIYTGFPTIVLSEIIADLIEYQKDLEGLFHVSSEPINKFELLHLVKDKLQLEKNIVPFDDFRIDRSLDSTKFRNKTNFTPLSWEKMIERMLDDPTPYTEWRNKIS